MQRACNHDFIKLDLISGKQDVPIAREGGREVLSAVECIVLLTFVVYYFELFGML